MKTLSAALENLASILDGGCEASESGVV